jgi:hypothetical protein
MQQILRLVPVVQAAPYLRNEFIRNIDRNATSFAIVKQIALILRYPVDNISAANLRYVPFRVGDREGACRRCWW